MRVIEKEIIRAMKAKKTIKLSKRDEVVYDRNGNESVYILWGTTVATLDWGTVDVSLRCGTTIMPLKWGNLVLTLGCWSDHRTTLSRINAFSRTFNVPTVYTKKHVTFWSDVEEYGVRSFVVNNLNYIKALDHY